MQKTQSLDEFVQTHKAYGKKAVVALITTSMLAGQAAIPMTAIAAELNGANAKDNIENIQAIDETVEEEAQEATSVDTASVEVTVTDDTTVDSAQTVIPATNTTESTDDASITDTSTDTTVTPSTDKSDTESSETNPEVTPSDESESDENKSGETDKADTTEDNNSSSKEEDTSSEVKSNEEEITTSGEEKQATVTEDVTQTPKAEEQKSENSESSLSQIDNALNVASGYNFNPQTYVAHHYTEDMTTEGFIASIGEEARQIAQENDLYASVMLAQAILESGSGTSTLSQAPNNNLFGIKGVWHDEDGVAHSATFKTNEDDGSGNLYQITSSFRAYTTTADSIEDYVRLLHDTEDGMGNYYKGAWKSNTTNYKDACYALQGTYATDTSYASKLMDLIETYDLTRFDEKLNYEITGKVYDPEAKDTESVEVDENGYRNLTMDDYANLEALATSFLGMDYVWGGSSPEEGFDCSGLVSYVYKEALGMDISRTTYTQQYKGEAVDFDDLRMGDLLFFVTDGDVHHVAMYLGDGYYIHSPKPGDVVKITSMEDYTPSFAKRIINFQETDNNDVVDDSATSTTAVANINSHNLIK